MRRRAWTLALLLFTAVARDVCAWGPKAHKVIAIIAERRLTPQAAAQVQALLSAENDRSLAAISTWADQIRVNPEFRFSANGHFMDIPLTATSGDIQQYCPDGDCITASLDAVGRAVADKAMDPAKRAIALKFFVHLLGDLHQPLHCADNKDAGGNKVKVLYHSRATNLHAVWDSAFVNDIPGDEQELATRIEQGITDAQVKSWTAPGSPATWAWESFNIAKSAAYTTGALRTPGQQPSTLPEGYSEAAQSIILQQMAKAGVRLAAQLNGRLPSDGHRNITTWLYPEKPAGSPGKDVAVEDPQSNPKAAFNLIWLWIAGGSTLLAALGAILALRKTRRRRVFVCYRRKTTQGHAGRIVDHLVRVFGRRDVFRDVESISPGTDFVDAIDERVTSCDAVVAVIGPEWARDPRLQNAADYVRRELANALRAGIPVIPVLVQDAMMPVADELPEELQPLCRRNAIAVVDQLFVPSVKALTVAILKLPRRRA